MLIHIEGSMCRERRRKELGAVLESQRIAHEVQSGPTRKSTGELKKAMEAAE